VASSPLAQDNDNDDDNNDNDDDNDNDGDNDDDGGGPPPPPPPPAAAAPPRPPTVASGCISGGGSVTLDFDSGSAAITNPGGGINVTLEAVDPNLGPGGPLGTIVFNMIAEACGGGGLGDPPPQVNLGVRYTVGANKAGLRIARFDGSQYTESGITTVPDPNQNFVSATIPARTATYAVVQR
jgi:hypothetical protein